MRIQKTTLLMVLGALAFALVFVTFFRWVLQRWNLPDFVISFVSILIAVGTIELAGRLSPRPFTGPLTGLAEETGRPLWAAVLAYIVSVLFLVLVFFSITRLLALLF
jgi:hypothetical protein